MSDSLGPLLPRDSYGRLLQIANENEGLDDTLRPVRDGKGDASPLDLSRTQARFNGPVQFLSATTGVLAEHVGFTAAGTGAVARTVAAKLGETVSVDDRGAVGDGVTDDTSAIQAAIDAIAAAGGGTLLASAKKYLVGALNIPGGVPITIQGAVVDMTPSDSSAEADAETGTVFKLKTNAAATMFTVQPSRATVTFRNLFMFGNQAGQPTSTSYAVNFLDDAVSGAGKGRSGKFERVRIERFRTGGIRAGINRNAGDITDCLIQTCGYTNTGADTPGGGYGLLIAAANDWRVDGLDVGACSQYGIFLTGAQNLVMYSTMSYANKIAGMAVAAEAGALRAVACTFDRNSREGVTILGQSGFTDRVLPYVFEACYFTANSRNNDGLYSDIRIEGVAPSLYSRLVLISPFFVASQDSTARPKYNIEANTSSTDIVLVGATASMASGAASARTAFINDVSKIATPFSGIGPVMLAPPAYADNAAARVDLPAGYQYWNTTTSTYARTT